MEPLKLFVIVLCILLGVGRGADLAFATDAATGFCTVGSVWWRYLALGVVVLAAVLAGRRQPVQPENLRCRRPAAGVLAFAGAVCMLAAAATQFAFVEHTVSALVRIMLESLCAVWLSTLGHCWLTGKPWKTPAGGLYLAVAGSLVFYWNVLLRFMENSSSWHRVTPTAAVWQELAALLFLSALARALYLPRPENDRTLHAAGLAASALCLCWELPRLLVLAGSLSWPEVLAGLALCCIGGLGLVCTLPPRTGNN